MAVTPGTRRATNCCDPRHGSGAKPPSATMEVAAIVLGRPINLPEDEKRSGFSGLTATGNSLRPNFGILSSLGASGCKPQA